MVCSRKAAVETPVSLAHLYSDSLLSKKSSKRGLTRRPLFLVRGESLVCTVEMIGPSPLRRRRDALPRVRRCTSRRFFLLLLRTRSYALGAEALAHQLNPTIGGKITTGIAIGEESAHALSIDVVGESVRVCERAAIDSKQW